MSDSHQERQVPNGDKQLPNDALIFFRENIDAFLQWQDDLRNESDRGCVLVAAAMLDEAALELLRSLLRDNRAKFEKLTRGALQPFGNRIDLLVLLGGVSDRAGNNLDLIKKIRNKVAHSSSAFRLDSRELRQDIANLSFHWRRPDDSARIRFVSTCACLLAVMRTGALAAKRPDPREDPSDRMLSPAFDRELDRYWPIIEEALVSSDLDPRDPDFYQRLKREVLSKLLGELWPHEKSNVFKRNEPRA
ncbi:MAG: hypothetical protein KIT54_00475 [Phycisphaeraceae bacterium]|nr:hypothetical protein [Phycisphaeraceae bacterium]